MHVCEALMYRVAIRLQYRACVIQKIGTAHVVFAFGCMINNYSIMKLNLNILSIRVFCWQQVYVQLKYLGNHRSVSEL